MFLLLFLECNTELSVKVCFCIVDIYLTMQMARLDGYNPQTNMKDAAFDWTDVYEKCNPLSASGIITVFLLIKPVDVVK